MATITLNSDGNLSLGNLRAEIITLKPAAADYPTGGYLVQGIGGGVNGNIGMDKVLGVIPIGGQGGVVPVFNPTTSKVQMLEVPFAGTEPTTPQPLSEVAAATDLSAYTFQFLVIGL